MLLLSMLSISITQDANAAEIDTIEKFGFTRMIVLVTKNNSAVSS